MPKMLAKVVHRVSLSQEEWWVADGTAMRQPGEDKVKIVALSIMKYRARTSLAEQNIVLRTQATPDTRTKWSWRWKCPDGGLTTQDQYAGFSGQPNQEWTSPANS